MLTDTKVAAIKPPAEGREEYPDAKVIGLRLRVGSSGQKTWIVRRRAGARVVNKKLGTYPAMSLGKARGAALRIIEALESAGGAEAADRTFGAAVKAWLDKKRTDRTRNKSVDLQERRLELHVLPHWKDKRLAEIKRADVRDLIESLEGDVLPNRVLTVVRTVLRYALSRDWIEASPAEGIDKPKDEAARDRWLEMGEAVRVWNAAALVGYPFGPFVRMLLLTGQRRTEVASMRWDSLDLEAGTWILKAADTKGAREHLVPLSAPALAVLADLPRMGPYVFTTDGETHFQGFAKAKAALDKFIAAGGELAPWRLHDLRRTAATHMIRLGVSEEVVGRVLNHAKQGVTGKVYALHSYLPEKRSALDQWGAEVARAVSGEGGGKVLSLRRGK